MKVFQINIDNGPEWKYDNSLTHTFYVLGVDTTEALMVALETVNTLREKLSVKGFTEQAKSLDIYGITAMGDLVGHELSTESLDEWCSEVTKKIKKNSDL